MSEQNTEVPAVIEALTTGEQTLVVEQTKSRVELTGQQLAQLISPISDARVASRNVGGANLSYVEAWDIKATLIRLFGFGGFSVEVVESKILDIRDDGRQGIYPVNHQKAGTHKTPYVMAYARVTLTIFGIGPRGEDAVYTEAAVGTNDGWTIGDVADNALKSAASDALKRCAIYLGTQFGLSLYNSGARHDVVRTILNPEQDALLKAHFNTPQARMQEHVQGEAASAAIARSLGGKPLSDVQRQALAGEESQVPPAEVADDGTGTAAVMAEEQGS